MSDEELREKVARVLASDTFCDWTDMLQEADRAIAICREHFAAEIAQLRRERDEVFEKAETALRTMAESSWTEARRFGLHAGADRIRALRKEEGDA